MIEDDPTIESELVRKILKQMVKNGNSTSVLLAETIVNLEDLTKVLKDKGIIEGT